jgi:tetratricopeptide (TPR) repeat protein
MNPGLYPQVLVDTMQSFPRIFEFKQIEETQYLMSKKKQTETKQKKSTSLSYFVFLLLMLVILLSLKKLNTDSTPPQKSSLPSVDLNDVDPMIVQAIKNAEQRVNSSPTSAQKWGELGVTYWVNELSQPGRECFKKAQELDPNEGKWLYFNGLTYLPGKIESAIPLIAGAADLLDSQTYAPRLRLANILSEDGQTDQAEPHFKKILEYRPDNPMSQLGLGRVAMANGNGSEAIRYFELCKDHPFTKKAANNALATLYLRVDKADLAAAAQTTAEAITEDSKWTDKFIEEASQFKLGLTAWLESAGKLVQRGQYSSALPIIDKIITHYPETGQAYIYLAKIRLAERKYTEAETALKSALKYDQDSVEARVQLGVALMWQKRFSESIDILKTAIEKSPDLAEAHYNLGLSLASNNEPQAAMEAFSNTIRLKPGLPDSYIGLATMLAQANQKQEAIQTLEQARKISPNHPRILAMLDQLKTSSP